MNLLPELQSAVRSVNPLMLTRVRQLGICNPGVAEMGLRHHQFGVARVAVGSGPHYSPDPDGVLAMIVPVYEDDTLVDLVAFKSTEPERWWLRTGNGWSLGLEESLDRRWWIGEPVALHKTPLAWLQAGCGGLCIVDWTAIQHLRELCDLSGLVINDSELEARLLDALALPVRGPTIIKEQTFAA